MRFHVTFITGMSLLFMVLALVLAFTDAGGTVSRKYFFTSVGILGWFIGNHLANLEQRVTDLERALAQRERAAGSEVPAAGGAS